MAKLELEEGTQKNPEYFPHDKIDYNIRFLMVEKVFCPCLHSTVSILCLTDTAAAKIARVLLSLVPRAGDLIIMAGQQHGQRPK